MESKSRCENCIIRQFNSMKAMSHDELKRVSEAKITKSVKKGEYLFDEGEKLKGVYCVREGISKLSKLSSNGKGQIVKLAQKGEVIGQRSVIADESTNLSAMAVNDMTVCFIPKNQIVDSLRNNPDFAVELLKHMANDLKEADNVIVNMSQKSVRQRTAETFLYLKDHFGEDEEGYLRPVLSREDIAGIVGTATESAIRIISEFRKNGVIDIKGKKIRLLNVEELNRIIEGF